MASELTHDDLEATSTIFSILKGICARRAAANARAAAAAKAGSGGTGEGGGGTPPTAGEDPQKADKDAKARNEAWNLEAEVELISKVNGACVRVCVCACVSSEAKDLDRAGKWGKWSATGGETINAAPR